MSLRVVCHDFAVDAFDSSACSGRFRRARLISKNLELAFLFPPIKQTSVDRFQIDRDMARYWIDFNLRQRFFAYCVTH